MSLQSDTFSDWNYTCSQLRNLSNHIQNDFKRLKADNYITNEEIYQDKIDFLKQYEKLTTKIDELKLTVVSIFDSELNSK